MALTGTEIAPLRRKVGERAIGDVYALTYNIAPENLSTIPARGSLDASFTLSETSDILKPRIINVQYVQQRSGAFQQVVITFLHPIILSGGSSTDNWKETRNSRVTQPGQFRREAVIYGLCSDETHADVPATGDTYPPDSALDLPRVCSEVNSDPNAVPGLYYITAKYRGSIGA